MPMPPTTPTAKQPSSSTCRPLPIVTNSPLKPEIPLSCRVVFSMSGKLNQLVLHCDTVDEGGNVIHDLFQNALPCGAAF